MTFSSLPSDVFVLQIPRFSGHEISPSLTPFSYIMWATQFELNPLPMLYTKMLLGTLQSHFEKALGRYINDCF